MSRDFFENFCHVCKANTRLKCILKICNFLLFVFVVALRPKSTAMVMAGRSVHLTTLFPGQA